MSLFKKKTIYKITVMAFFAVVAAVTFLYIRYKDLLFDSEVTFVRYPAFGIDMPTDYSIHGIDVSRYQKKVNWWLVKKMKVDKINLQFCFIKATEGISMVDEQFNRNWNKSKDVGMIRGAYHYFIPYSSGKAQAQNFIETVELQKGDLPPVLDIETISGSTITELKKNAKEWLQTVQDYYKVKPVIYSGADFYTRYLGDDFSGYPLWVAHYEQKKRPSVMREWIIWQHNQTGHVNGIETYVDFNAFSGDSNAFKKLLIQ